MKKALFAAAVACLCLAAFSHSWAGPAEELEQQFVSVSENAGRAVVTVLSTKMVTQQYGYRGPQFQDPFFNEFFRDFFGAPPGGQQEIPMQGLGSGFLIDKSGYIMTNEHVIEGADEVEITLPDGRKFIAAIIGADKRSDVAVLKIEGEDLPVLPLGDSDKLRTGQWVIAVGNPYGHVVNNPDPTVTVGVVSALHRSLDLGEEDGRFYRNLIQTDAAINRGNSGGPLIDIKGHVVGINTLIFSTSGGSQGIGFAIPVNHARRIYSQIIKGQEVTYPWLGVWIQPLSKDLMQFNVDTGGLGALVWKVQEGSPAEKSGIRIGDIILKVGGKEIRNPHDLVNTVSSFEVSQKVNVDLIRDGKKMQIEVEVGAKPQEAAMAGTAERGAQPGNEEKSWRGIVVRGISDSDRQNPRRAEAKGVIIKQIAPYSPAHYSGLMEGFLIDQVNTVPVTSAEEFYKAAEGQKGKVRVHTDAGFFVVDEEKEKNEEGNKEEKK